MLKPQGFSLREAQRGGFEGDKWGGAGTSSKKEVTPSRLQVCKKLRAATNFNKLADHINLGYDYGKPFGQVWRWDPLAEVRLQEGEPLENALRRFKRKVQQEDIIKEVKRHSYYLKPGEKRRVKAALARKRNRKKARKEQD
jgi:small subunit ribosomal protein S21